MKYITLLILLFSSTLFGQKTLKPKPPITEPMSKDSVIYLSPVGEKNDTVSVYAVLASIKEPLTLQEYTLITKFYLYKNGTKTMADQWLEKTIEGIVTRIYNWKKKTVYILTKTDFLKE